MGKAQNTTSNMNIKRTFHDFKLAVQPNASIYDILICPRPQKQRKYSGKNKPNHEINKTKTP